MTGREQGGYEYLIGLCPAPLASAYVTIAIVIPIIRAILSQSPAAE